MIAEKKRPNLTKEQILKAMQCKTADELVALAKSEGYDLSKEHAQAFLDEFEEELLKKVAGGTQVCYAVGGCAWHL